MSRQHLNDVFTKMRVYNVTVSAIVEVPNFIGFIQTVGFYSFPNPTKATTGNAW